MTRDIRDRRNNNGCENSGSSMYTMLAVAGCLLLCIGIIVYAFIGA